MGQLHRLPPPSPADDVLRTASRAFTLAARYSRHRRHDGHWLLLAAELVLLIEAIAGYRAASGRLAQAAAARTAARQLRTATSAPVPGSDQARLAATGFPRRPGSGRAGADQHSPRRGASPSRGRTPGRRS
jgi:hypothetical protein